MNANGAWTRLPCIMPNRADETRIANQLPNLRAGIITTPRSAYSSTSAGTTASWIRYIAMPSGVVGVRESGYSNVMPVVLSTKVERKFVA